MKSGASVSGGVGRGWMPLCEELDARLARLDPPGQLLGTSIDASGLPRFRVSLDPQVKDDGRRLVRACESRALELCEVCGGPGRVRAGVILTARCDHCT